MHLGEVKGRCLMPWELILPVRSICEEWLRGQGGPIDWLQVSAAAKMIMVMLKATGKENRTVRLRTNTKLASRNVLVLFVLQCVITSLLFFASQPSPIHSLCPLTL